MIFDGKLYLNLEKQVQKNKEDIEYIINQEGALNQFGLRVVGQVETISDMPTIQAYKQSNPNWEYGDAFMVGASTEEATVVDIDNATLLVLTRANTVYPNDFWMNLGKFPKPGPVGPKGEQGEQGIQGVKGIGVMSGSSNPTASAPATTTYINATTGDVFVYSGQQWDKIGNIKGATGSVGPVGPQGKTGPIGQTGATGPQGPRGIGVNILGTLTSTSQLPNPTTVGKDSAYIIPADGVNHLWVIEGTDNLVWTDFGTAGLGEKGDKGDAGVGIDTMTDLDLTYGNTIVTYNTNDGMTINGHSRFTYDGGTTKDVTMDIDVPVVAGEGITIDKVNGQEKVEVKLDTAFTDGKYMGKIAPPDQFVYAYGYAGNKPVLLKATSSATSNQLAYRGSDGTLKVGTAVADSDAIPKKQVEDGFVAKVTTGNVNQAYTVDTNNQQAMMWITEDAGAWALARRYTDGRLQVGTPVGVNDATNKAYVDGLHHYTHHIHITDGTSEIYITLAIKNYPNAVTTLDGVTELVEALTGEIQPIMATGVVNGHNVHAVLVQADRKLYAKFYDSTKGILTDKVQVLFNDTATVHDIVA